MSRRWVILLVASMALTSTGCISKRVNNIMASWTGHHYSELLMSWGPPSAVYEDGQGGRILVWTATRQFTTPGRAVTTTTSNARVYDNIIWGQAQSFTQFTPPQTTGYVAYRMFQIDSSGRIYNWSWRGL